MSHVSLDLLKVIMPQSLEKYRFGGALIAHKEEFFNDNH